MRVAEMNWRMVENWVARDDRAVLPLGSIEQHAGLSLATDAILAERVAAEAAEPLGVPVFPVLAYGIAPYFAAFPGSLTLRVTTYAAVLRDLLDSLKRSGFRRILLVNGHGGNHPAGALAQEWMMDNADCRIRLHDWWRAPRTWAAIQATDPSGSHGNWMESLPWTRVAGGDSEDVIKDGVDVDRLKTLPPIDVRNLIDDGSYGGRYRRPDGQMLAIWTIAVQETRALMEGW